MYAKLFASLYQGTLRGQSNEILVFTNLLAHTGKDGTVDKHFRAIAEETGLSIDSVKAAIDVLEAPDPESRSPDEEGARIVRLDEHRVWGWRVVNHAKYRAIRSEDDRAEQNRIAQQKWREKKKQRNDDNKQSKPSVSVISPSRGRGSKQIQEADTLTPPCQPKASPSGFEDFWNAYPKRVGKGNAEKVWVKLKCNSLLPQILTCIRKAKSSQDWTKEAGQFIPHPATWLNRKGWEDEYSVNGQTGSDSLRTLTPEEIAEQQRDTQRRSAEAVKSISVVDKLKALDEDHWYKGPSYEEA